MHILQQFDNASPIDNFRNIVSEIAENFISMESGIKLNVSEFLTSSNTVNRKRVSYDT